MATPPALGEVEPGQLLVDPQTLTIWVGVDTSVSSAGALLVCDMQQLAAADATILAQANAYTDGRLNGTIPTTGGVAYSQVNHTHTASQITNFNAAVQAAIGSNAIPRGAIMLWSGPAGQVGLAGTALADWRVCNGNNDPDWGTYLPDLRNKFILGSGDGAPYPPGWNTGPEFLGVGVGDSATALPTRTFATELGGGHTPNVQPISAGTPTVDIHYLTQAELPAVRLTPFSPTGDGQPAKFITRWTDGSGDNGYKFVGASDVGELWGEQTYTDYIGDGLPHGHTSSALPAHDHGVDAVPDHAHAVKPNPTNVPFYALCYIIKVR